MKRTFFVTLIGFFSFTALSNSARELFYKAQDSFQKDDCAKAIKSLEKINPKTDLESADSMITAYKIMSICLFNMGDKEKAQSAVKEIFLIDPDYKFDAFSTPEEIVDLAQKERIYVEEKSAHLFKIKKDLDKKNEPKIVVIEEKLKSDPLSYFLPFGLNHFALDNQKRGIAYMSIEASLLTSNIAFFWLKQSTLVNFGKNDLASVHDQGKFRTFQGLQLGSLVLLIICYGISVADAFLSLK